MAGSAQAANLTGMLNNIAETVGEMGKASDWTHQNIRDYSAPKLDQNDPDSMLKYAKYLQANGQQEAAIAMQGRAAEATQRKNQQKGLESLSNLRSTLVTNYDEWMKTPQGKQKIQAVQGAMAQVANKYDFDPETFQNTFAYNGEEGRATRVGEGQGQQALDNDAKYNAEDIRMQEGRLALQERQRQDQNRQFNTTETRATYEFGVNADQNFRALDLREAMDNSTILRNTVLNDETYANMDSQAIRDDLAVRLGNEEISMGTFTRVMMNDKNMREWEQHPIQLALLESQTEQAMAMAGFTNAQKDEVRYNIGFKRRTEDLREQALKLDNRLTGAQVKQVNSIADLNTAKADIVPLEGAYLEAQIASTIATDELNKDKLKLEQKRLDITSGIEQAKVEVLQDQLNIDRDVAEATIAQVQAETISTQMANEIAATAAIAERTALPQLAAARVGLNNVDLTSTQAIDNARLMFANTHGVGSVVHFDTILDRRLATATATDQLRKANLDYESATPVTAETMKSMGMPQQEIDRINGLKGDERNKQLSAWITGERAGTKIAEPTAELVELYMPLAKRIKIENFGVGAFGLGIIDGVDDDHLWADASFAMARAAASGMSDADIYLAGQAAAQKYKKGEGLSKNGEQSMITNLQSTLED